jgi:hypothetical protein
MRSTATVIILLAIALGVSEPAASRPERIRPGVSYYSDDFVLTGQIHDLVGEKNLEEVYQRYQYYEAVYDQSERVVVFKEYLRGELVRTEKYDYGADGSPTQKTVTRPGEPARVIPIEAPAPQEP